MSITKQLYDKLCPDDPLESREDWEEVYNYVDYIDGYMKRHGYGLGDCHYPLLKLWYDDTIDMLDEPTTGDKEHATRLKKCIDHFTSELYELKLIG